MFYLLAQAAPQPSVTVAPTTWTPEVWMAFFAFLTLVFTNIFQMIQNRSIKKNVEDHAKESATRNETVKAEIADCKTEICKMQKPPE